MRRNPLCPSLSGTEREGMLSRAYPQEASTTAMSEPAPAVLIRLRPEAHLVTALTITYHYQLHTALT
jgi:hypothetical protein